MADQMLETYNIADLLCYEHLKVALEAEQSDMSSLGHTSQVWPAGCHHPVVPAPRRMQRA